jgi:hypothetical protein
VTLLRFFPLWLVGERWRTRDATIFYHQMLIETSLNLLAVLAGLNHLYFSSFQFKWLHRFVGKMRLAPECLADRLDGVFALDPVDAGIAMERLVDETVSLVEAHMPAVNTAQARRLGGVSTPGTRRRRQQAPGVEDVQCRLAVHNRRREEQSQKPRPGNSRSTPTSATLRDLRTRLLDAPIPRFLSSGLHHDLNLDAEADRRGDSLPEGRHEARSDAVARDRARGTDEQGCSIPSDQRGRSQPGLHIGPGDIVPPRQLGQGRSPDLPV